MKNNKLFVLALFLFICLAICLVNIRRLKIDNNILKNNQEVLFDSIKHYKILDSLNAARINELQLSRKELDQYYPDAAKLAKEITKHEKLQTVETVNTETKQTVNSVLKDTLLITKTDTVIKNNIICRIDTINNWAKTLDYHSYWTDVRGLIFEDSVSLQIRNREELIATISKQKKKFLGIRLPGWLFGYKYNRLDVISKNPNTQITEIQFINIKK